MDYKSIMDENNFNYPELYNNIMKEIASLIINRVSENEVLEKALEDKRNFGLKKYGEYSFQFDFKNSITSPSEKHLEEELIDAINYIMHSMYKSKTMFIDNTIYEREFRVASKLVSLYEEVIDINDDKYA